MFEAKIAKTIAVALLMVGASLLYAQKPPSKQKLILLIRTDKPSTSISEDLHLDLQFVNVGSGPLLLFRELGAGVGRTNLRVFDEHGKEVMSRVLADEIPPPPSPHSKDAFVEIKINESFRTQLIDSLENIVNHRPGNYEMFVEYTSMISDSWARDFLSFPVERIWTRDRGMIVSNRIRITVTE
jgi:hypothetical protein